MKLEIKKAGYLLTLPGMNPVRTPAIIDISKCNINNVFLYLKTQGINEFKIISEEDTKQKNIKTQTKKVYKEEIIQPIIKQDDDKTLNRLQHIEQLLNKLIEREPTVIIQEQNKNIPIKKKIEKEVEFVPSFDLSGEVKGNMSVQQQTDNSNINEVAELLKSIKK